MPDPSRTESSGLHDAESGVDRDAKIERLLLLGLDHYFRAQYDQAINVWTRVLFLDRTHQRARAYLERARGALAERQRASEELLHTGVAAFERGEGREARRLLQAAIDGGAPPDEALAVLDRLNRLEPGVKAPAKSRPDRRQESVAQSPARPASRGRFLWLAVGVVVAGVALASAIVWNRFTGDDDVTDRPGTAAAVAPAAELSLSVPTRGEVAMTRARTFIEGGRWLDALGALNGVRAGDPQKSAADDLRADIQRRLLVPAPEPSQIPPIRESEGRRQP